MATKTPNILQRYPLAAYFVLAYAITWGGSIVYYLSTPAGGRALPAFLLLPAAIVWYYGPALSALLVTRANEGPGSIRRLLGGLLKWRVGWRWYAFIVVYPLALHLLVVGLDWLMGGPAPVFFEASGVPEGNPLLILLGLALLQFFQRGIGEETGWRAFALPSLQSAPAAQECAPIHARQQQAARCRPVLAPRAMPLQAPARPFCFCRVVGCSQQARP